MLNKFVVFKMIKACIINLESRRRVHLATAARSRKVARSVAAAHSGEAPAQRDSDLERDSLLIKRHIPMQLEEYLGQSPR